ncbi:MAG: substrate-binding domain-containing protein [Spirochaetota bacterium]
MRPKLFLCFCAAAVFVTGIAAAGEERLKLATTTSTDNSGLLELLIPPFERQTGLTVDIIAVGTGAAVALGENGDVDVILVHARSREEAFIAAGYGVGRRALMHNDFVILGPRNDPAGIKGMSNAPAALKKIGRAGETFISRGDDSGTHVKERELWTASGYAPAGRWYKEVGQGMGTVITMTDDMRGYTLADRGTYLSMRDRVSLTVLVEGDERLHNPYGVIAVNPDIHPHVNYEGAAAFIEYLTGPRGQTIIGNFRADGERLFFPDAIP